MKTELKLGLALKKLMATEPLDSITVQRLTQICGVNRQTFYYHFRNIYDLLTWIYLNESVENLDNVASWEEALTYIFSYVKQNSAFVQNTLASAGRELFIEFLYSTTFSMQLQVLNQTDREGILTSDQRKFVSNFYTPSFVYLTVRWVDGGMKEDPKKQIEQVGILAENYLTEAIEKYRAYKTKKA